MSTNLKAFFQKLARAFLIPVSLIGVASLIMAIGCIFTDSAIIELIPFFGCTAIQYFGNFLVTTGVQVLHNLALVYAMALAFGLAKEKKDYVEELDDDEATIKMVDSNIYRNLILPSEKAFAYKMKLEAIKHQGKKNELRHSLCQS